MTSPPRNKSGNAGTRRSRFAFTLMEALLVLSLTGALSGAGFLAVTFLNRGSPKKEAQYLARWLTDIITAANRTGRAFVLFCPPNRLVPTVTITWQQPPEKETYTSLRGCRFLSQGSGAQSFYSSQWNTFSPAITIRVTNGRAKEDHYVIVSLYGQIRTNKIPP